MGGEGGRGECYFARSGGAREALTGFPRVPESLRLETRRGSRFLNGIVMRVFRILSARPPPDLLSSPTPWYSNAVRLYYTMKFELARASETMILYPSHSLGLLDSFLTSFSFYLSVSFFCFFISLFYFFKLFLLFCRTRFFCFLFLFFFVSWWLILLRGFLVISILTFLRRFFMGRSCTFTSFLRLTLSLAGAVCRVRTVGHISNCLSR